ncbi:MAG: AI-2E family transporter [Bacteroidia bacterium]|nr:AI-2E family transporter [Bacteroidia bacterium]
MPSEWTKKKFTHQFVLVALLITAFLLIYTMWMFIDAFLGAVILYVLFRPTMHRLINTRNWGRGWASLLVILLSFILVLIPILFMSYMIIPKISMLFSQGSVTMNVITQADQKIFELTGYKLLTEKNILQLQESAAGFVTNFLGESMILLTDIALLYLVLYFLLKNTGRIEAFLNKNLPVTEERLGFFAKELESQTFSNALAAPLLALVQAIFAAVGYWLFGVPDPVFWGVMTGFFSFLPVVGSTLIWLPAAIYQLSAGFTWQGIGILLYGLLVISMVDNVFRFVFQKRFANVHPLVTVIGVISGLQLFGVPGIIFGPLLISYFILLLKIFKEEYLMR